MKAVAMDTAEDSLSQTSDEQLVSLQIYVPELIVQKCMQFNKEELIWDVKNQILAALPKELKEGFNYGLFCPPVNGRAGKFLDEERPLADYPFTDNSAYVELRYKRRIYKINMEEKQLKQLHSRANLRRLLDHIHNNHVEKITKMCSRGLDPNFHCQETGESPLTLATSLKHPAKVIMALVNGGAHLDFRTKDGCTVLHKAVEKNNLEALRTLLDLGSSPNYKDMRGLTTLYYSIVYNSNPQLTEMLLHDHAMTGTADPHGWQEVHQACKYGLVQHLEHLLFYGADMNARNASGNTPLHVCAVNDQESCARVLLFRGADKNALNYANQNPHQVAVIAGNLRLAEIIKNHKPEDVVPYREAPRYNPRRRTSAANMGSSSQNHSDPRLELVMSGGKPPSPCPSNHSLPHLSSSDGHHNSGEEDADDTNMTNHSSAVETGGAGANSSGTDSDPFDSAKSTPLMESVCICVEEYNPSTSGHLQLAKGDLIQILAVSGSGYLEGRRRDGEEGLFPAACIQEMTIRCADTLPAAGRMRADARRNLNARGDYARKWKTFGEPRTVILHKGKKGFGFILRGAKATSPLMERQPTEFWPSLQYLDDVDKGGVAEMAGLKKGDFLLEINGQDVSQASHERVVTIIRQSGDLVSMTVVTVIQQSATTLPPAEKPQLINRQCATLPRKLSTKKAPLPPKRDPKTTLSVGRARARSMVAGLAEIEVLDHTLNEYDSEGRSTKSSSVESIPNKPSSSATPESTATTTPTTATTTPTSTHQTTAGARSRPSSHHVSATELEDFFARHLSVARHHGTIRNRYATIARIHKMKHLKRSKHKSKDDADYRMPKNYSSTPELIFPSTSDFDAVHFLKRSRSLSDLHARHSSRYAWVGSKGSGGRDHRHNRSKDKTMPRQHSIPEGSRVPHGDKARNATPEPSGPSLIKQNGSDIYAETVPVSVKSGDKTSGRASCPPPSYPPPPPPVGQVVKVDVSRGECADLTPSRQHKSTAIMSSFRPTDSAKLYASPDAFVTVGYKDQPKCDSTLPRHLVKGTGSRSQSLPPKMPQTATSAPGAAPGGGSSTASLDADHSSGDSASAYTPFKGSHRSGDHTGTESGHPPDRRGTLRKVKQGKYPAAVSETASPKHYPNLTQEPDYDTSEEDDNPPSGVENKGGLVTFKALENEVPKDPPADAKAKAEMNANMTLRRKRLKSQASVDSGKLQAEESINENRVNAENVANSQSSEAPQSAVLQSEETGERIFVRSEKSDSNDSERHQTKKVAPVPPPKSKDSMEDREPNANVVKGGGDRPTKDEQDASTRSSSKEPIAFKATIVLKQTEVVAKDAKETPFRIKNKELIHQHSAHELLHLKNKDDTLRKEGKETQSRDKLVKSPSQGFKERQQEEVMNQKIANSQNDSRVKQDPSSNQKVAPAVPKKPKADESKMAEDVPEPPDAVTAIQSEGDEVKNSPMIDAASRSVKENIFNFEKRSNELSTNKVNLSPRRKSDVIRITLVGSQQKGNEPERTPSMSTMKTSKSCPKTFEEDVDMDVESSLTAAMLHSDAHNQVTRFSAETPTTTIASTNFSDDWRRPDVTSPVNVLQYVDTVAKKPPDTPPKNTMARRGDNFSKTQTLGRKMNERDYDYQDVESTHFTETMTLNRQSLAKSDNAKYQQLPEGMLLHSVRDNHQTRIPVMPVTTASPPTTMLPPSNQNYPGQYQQVRPQIPTGAYYPNANIPSNMEPIHLPANIPLEISQKLIAEHMANVRNREAYEDMLHHQQLPPQSKPPDPMSAQARLLDHRHTRITAPAPNRVSPPKTREDDECLKLCQRVDKSLQLIRLQVDSLRMAAASEPEVLPELVPPPPEFNFAAHVGPQQSVHIAPPPEFSDESLARQRRAQQNMITTMDAPVSRRVVPPDTANYPYPEHVYRGYHPAMQSPQDHPHHPMHHHPHNVIPNNLTASPTKTMTLSRGGYPTHHSVPPHQQIRHQSNCNTLPHPGSARMMMPPQALQQQLQQQQMQQQQMQHRPSQPQQQPQHPYPQSRTSRESPRMMGPIGPIPPIPQHKEFRQKPLHQWNMKDVADWLESLFLPEYKITFAEAGITGSKLANMDNNDLMGLGVKQAGHRLNMERSIKWYLK